jgi:hypothetical protein
VWGEFLAAGDRIDVLQTAEDDVLHAGLERGVGLLFPQLEFVGRGRCDGRRQKEGRSCTSKGAHELSRAADLERHCEQLRPLRRQRASLEAIHISRQRTNAIALYTRVVDSFSQLEAFTQVVAYQSFSRAAERLGVTPSSVSRAVVALESASGCACSTARRAV